MECRGAGCAARPHQTLENTASDQVPKQPYQWERGERSLNGEEHLKEDEDDMGQPGCGIATKVDNVR